MSETTLRRTLPEAYTIGIGGGSYLGLIGDGAGTTSAVAYTGGEWTALLGETSAFDATADLVWPPVYEADRYLVVVPSFDELLVWDLEEATIASYNPPAGWSVIGAGVVDGTVYWVERETVEHGSGPYAIDVRLRTAGWDLASASTVCTRSVSVSGGESVDSPLGTGATLGVFWNAAAALVEWSWVDQVAEDQGVVRVRLPLVGATAQADVTACSELGLPTSGGESAAINRNGLLDGSILIGFPDSVSGTPASLWPVNDAYTLQPRNAGVTAAGTVAVVYGTDDDVPTLVRSPLAGAPATPSERATVSEYGALGAPNYLYPRD